MSSENSVEAGLLYSINDKPPHLLSAFLGFQIVILILSGIVLVPLIALNAADAQLDAKNWAVFAALLVSGAVTIIQAKPIGSFGAGYVLFMGTSGAFIAISIAALKAGGLPLLSILIIVSSLIQFLFSKRLGLIRKIVTPTVGGTVITLIAIAVMPIAFQMMNQTPVDDNTFSYATAWSVGVTIISMLLLSLFGKKQFRLWGPVIGVVLGSMVAWIFGLVDLHAVINTKMFGLPNASWPGLDLSFNATFWVMLPGFMIVTIVGAIETYGDGIAIQQVSRRGQHATDFKAVQGAINADGLGNLLSGLIGTLPNTTYSTSISVVEITGVAAKRVGIYGGIFMIILAFSPKVSALLQAIPAPVTGGFIFFLIVMLFVHGIRLIISDGFSFENSTIFGVSLWAGYGFQGQLVFHDLMPSGIQQLLDNGVTSGTIVAVILSFLITLKRSRSEKITVSASLERLHDVVSFARGCGKLLEWSHNDLLRLELAVEEAFLYLVEKSNAPNQLKIQMIIRSVGDRLEIELVSAPTKDNIENLLKNMRPIDNYSDEHLRIKILTSMVDSISHQQFNQQDYLSIIISKKVLLEICH